MPHTLLFKETSAKISFGGTHDAKERMVLVKLEKAKLACHWTWNTKDETCGICQMPFDGCCPDCKIPGDDCPIVWGPCEHSFHLHCILKWLNSRQHCPLCRREWHFN